MGYWSKIYKYRRPNVRKGVKINDTDDEIKSLRGRDRTPRLRRRG